MKTIYLLTTKLMNGTVTLSSISSCYSGKDLAERVKVAVDEANSGKNVISDITEVTLYDDDSEIPILN